MKQSVTPKILEFSCEKCCYATNVKKDYEKHLTTSKHKSVTLKILDFSCEKCCYATNVKKDYEKHLTTSKHKSVTENPICTNFVPHECKKCNAVFTNRTTLWRHSKKCSSCVNPDLTNLIMEVIRNNADLQKQNQEFKDLITEQNKTLIDTMRNNTINNTINSHNKTFNLSVFLNEQCKDAMNMKDFVDSIQLQYSDLENVGRLGFVNGISEIIIKNLKALDIHRRPVHCADLKREIMYVKDNNQWNKEEEDNNKLRRAIKCIAQKNSKNLVLFKQKHPDCMQGDSRSSDTYNKLMVEAFGGGKADDETNEDKIIRRISKEVTIDKTM